MIKPTPELAEFCTLLNINDTTCLSGIKRYYRRFCVRFHPDKRSTPCPPPVVPPGASVCIQNLFWFTAPAVPGVYYYNGDKYAVKPAPVSNDIQLWSISNVLARLNCIKSAAYAQVDEKRPRAYAPVLRKDVLSGANLRVHYTHKQRREQCFEVIATPPGRDPPYVLRGKHVDVLIFLRPG